MHHKDSIIDMEDYINEFNSLVQEINLQRQKEIPEMSTTQINLTFFHSLSEKYEMFYHLINKVIYMINTTVNFSIIGSTMNALIAINMVILKITASFSKIMKCVLDTNLKIIICKQS